MPQQIVQPIVHFRDNRLYINAGIRFPLCHAHMRLLDMSKTSWDMTSIAAQVTCPRCLARLAPEAETFEDEPSYA